MTGVARSVFGLVRGSLKGDLRRYSRSFCPTPPSFRCMNRCSQPVTIPVYTRPFSCPSFSYSTSAAVMCTCCLCARGEDEME